MWDNPMFYTIGLLSCVQNKQQPQWNETYGGMLNTDLYFVEKQLQWQSNVMYWGIQSVVVLLEQCLSFRYYIQKWVNLQYTMGQWLL